MKKIRLKPISELLPVLSTLEDSVSIHKNYNNKYSPYIKN